MKCQVTSDTTRKVMISREVKVPSYKEICGEEKIRVHLGYNNDPWKIIVEDNKLLKRVKTTGMYHRRLKVVVQKYFLRFQWIFLLKLTTTNLFDFFLKRTPTTLLMD